MMAHAYNPGRCKEKELEFEAKLGYNGAKKANLGH